jgi:phosphoglycerate dehydrogenase-like enzyme
MLTMLRERRIAGIGLDVYKTEPLPKDHELRAMDNVVLSPHMGYVDDDTYDSWWPQTIENIAAFMEGNPIRLLQPKPGVF